MTAHREMLIDRMIRIYGFEDDRVLDFANMCEDPTITDGFLENIVEEEESIPVYLRDEEDQ